MANQEVLKSSGTASMKQRQQNAPSQEKRKQHTQNTSPQGKKETRNAKRRRWAKKNKPVVKQQSVRAVPVYEYISECCSLPARKPRAGQKEISKDPETGKMVNKAKGLGKFRCTGCGKRAKVTRRKPQSTEVPNGSVEAAQPKASS